MRKLHPAWRLGNYSDPIVLMHPDSGKGTLHWPLFAAQSCWAARVSNSAYLHSNSRKSSKCKSSMILANVKIALVGLHLPHACSVNLPSRGTNLVRSTAGIPREIYIEFSGLVKIATREAERRASEQ